MEFVPDVSALQGSALCPAKQLRLALPAQHDFQFSDREFERIGPCRFFLDQCRGRMVPSEKCFGQTALKWSGVEGMVSTSHGLCGI